MTGFNRIPNDFYETRFASNPHTHALFSWLRKLATYRESEVTWKGKRHILLPGQALVSYELIRSKLRISRQEYRRDLLLMRDAFLIDLQSSPHGTIVTICNYTCSQESCEQENQQKNLQRTNKEPTKNQQRTILEDLKTERREEEELLTTSVVNPQGGSTPPDHPMVIKFPRTKKPKPEGPSPEDLVKLWNENKGSLPGVEKLTGKRRAAVLARLKEEPSLDYWQDIVKIIAASDWCNAKHENNQTWKADFDFLVRPDTHVKAKEGKYDNRETKDKLSDDARMMAELNALEENYQKQNRKDLQ